jgi:hypothetical protein
MSEKRSDRLRSIIAATVSDAAEDAAPVTVTGSGMTSTSAHKPSAESPELSEPQHVSSNLQPASPLAIAAPESSTEVFPTVGPSPEYVPASVPDAGTTQGTTTDVGDRRRSVHPALRAPQRPTKIPKWEKANVTLEPRDLAILQRSDAQARAYGFRIRKGGNPSLFVRAGLRLLEELGDRDPEAWIRQIAATTPLGSDTPE